MAKNSENENTKTVRFIAPMDPPLHKLPELPELHEDTEEDNASHLKRRRELQREVWDEYANTGKNGDAVQRHDLLGRLKESLASRLEEMRKERDELKNRWRFCNVLLSECDLKIRAYGPHKTIRSSRPDEIDQKAKKRELPPEGHSALAFDGGEEGSVWQWSFSQRGRADLLAAFSDDDRLRRFSVDPSVRQWARYPFVFAEENTWKEVASEVRRIIKTLDESWASVARAIEELEFRHGVIKNVRYQIEVFGEAGLASDEDFEEADEQSNATRSAGRPPDAEAMPQKTHDVVAIALSFADKYDGGKKIPFREVAEAVKESVPSIGSASGARKAIKSATDYLRKEYDLNMPDNKPEKIPERISFYSKHSDALRKGLRVFEEERFSENPS